jgi:hypothetical protein
VPNIFSVSGSFSSVLVTSPDLVLNLNTVTYSTAIPEASTWSMMMLGFAGLGFAGSRASRKSAAIAA